MRMTSMQKFLEERTCCIKGVVSEPAEETQA